MNYLIPTFTPIRAPLLNAVSSFNNSYTKLKFKQSCAKLKLVNRVYFSAESTYFFYLIQYLSIIRRMARYL